MMLALSTVSILRDSRSKLLAIISPILISISISFVDDVLSIEVLKVNMVTT